MVAIRAPDGQGQRCERARLARQSASTSGQLMMYARLGLLQSYSSQQQKKLSATHAANFSHRAVLASSSSALCSVRPVLKPLPTRHKHAAARTTSGHPGKLLQLAACERLST
jgi:hypothetical protein